MQQPPHYFEAIVTDNNSYASKKLPENKTALNSSIDTNSPCFRPMSKFEMDNDKYFCNSKETLEPIPGTLSVRKDSFNRNYKTKPLTFAQLKQQGLMLP